MKIFALIGGALLAAACLIRPEKPGQPEMEAPAEDETAMEETQLIRATIRTAKHDMNPVTLQGWTRIICDCEDGVERTMSFDGDTGVYLTAGESGLLEHRDGVFVSFTKDSGEVVTRLYRMLPGDETDTDTEE